MKSLLSESLAITLPLYTNVQAEELQKRYKHADEIGVSMRHLKEGFDKFVQRRAEEMIASGYEALPEEETGMHF